MSTPPDDIELLRQLLHQYVPEIADGTVEIKALAWECGASALVLAHSHNPEVFPPTGERNALRPLWLQMGGDFVQFLRWSPSIEEIIRGILLPYYIKKIELDEPTRRATLTLDAEKWHFTEVHWSRTPGYEHGIIREPVTWDPAILKHISRVVKLAGWELVLIGPTEVTDLEVLRRLKAKGLYDGWGYASGPRNRSSRLETAAP